MEDAQIIELFFVRSEDAISELDKKYGKLCYKLADNILASAQDAEECVNDAYLSTWNAIPPQRPESLPAFVGTLVRRCSITRYRANTAMKRNSHYEMSYVANVFGHRIIDILLYRPELLFLACCKWEQFYDDRLPFSPLELTQEVAQFSESSRIAVDEFRDFADDPSPFSEDGFDDISLF